MSSLLNLGDGYAYSLVWNIRTIVRVSTGIRWKYAECAVRHVATTATPRKFVCACETAKQWCTKLRSLSCASRVEYIFRRILFFAGLLRGLRDVLSTLIVLCCLFTVFYVPFAIQTSMSERARAVSKMIYSRSLTPLVLGNTRIPEQTSMSV